MNIMALGMLHTFLFVTGILGDLLFTIVLMDLITFTTIIYNDMNNILDRQQSTNNQ